MNARLAYIIEMVVAVYFIAYLVPPALTTMIAVTITGAPAALITLLTTFIPILLVLGIALLLMPPEIKEYLH